MGLAMREYWRSVRYKAFREAAETLGLDSRLRAMIGAIGGVVIILALFFLGSEDAWKDEALFRLAAISVIVFAFPIVYVWKFIGMPARMHEEQAEEICSLRERLRPTVKVLFDPAVPGCVVPTKFGEIKFIYFRLKVDAIAHGGVGPCVGRLVSVEKDGNSTGYAESLQLTWAPAHGPDALSRIIADKTPTFLDVCFVTEKGVFGIATPGLMQPNSMNGIFEAGHRYGLKIVVAVSGHASEAIDLTLDLGSTSAETRMSASIVD